jgi:Protein of unknown function (DUF3047)
MSSLKFVAVCIYGATMGPSLLSGFVMKIVAALFFLIFTSSLCPAAEIVVGAFSSGNLSGWEAKPFKGKTVYSLVPDGEKKVLMAHSRHAASGLLRKITLDTRKYPLLRWTWKVSHSLGKEDITKKSGADFAARVYVVFPRTFFWQTRAINYVWAAKMPKYSSAPSPYTSNAMIIAVESGDGKAGNWVTEERNIYEDYKQLFGEDPPKLGAVAVMTDTDDTRDEVTAWYGDITLADTMTVPAAHAAGTVTPVSRPASSASPAVSPAFPAPPR